MDIVQRNGKWVRASCGWEVLGMDQTWGKSTVRYSQTVSTTVDPLVVLDTRKARTWKEVWGGFGIACSCSLCNYLQRQLSKSICNCGTFHRARQWILGICQEIIWFMEMLFPRDSHTKMPQMNRHDEGKLGVRWWWAEARPCGALCFELSKLSGSAGHRRIP